jgi:hypothetical protein
MQQQARQQTTCGYWCVVLEAVVGPHFKWQMTDTFNQLLQCKKIFIA